MALQTYTASGQIRPGPVAAPTDASVLDRPARAIERAGYQIQGAAQDVAQIAEQKKRETDLQWAVESAAQYDRVLAERRAADAQNPKETQAVEFKDFADQQLSEYSKNAPSSEALNLFRRHGLTSANQGYEHSLHAAELTRLTNADVANDKSTSDIVASYKAIASIDSPEGAAQDISRLVNLQLASIDTRFGQSAPKLAEKMKTDTVTNVALGTASTNPAYARQLVDSAPIDEKVKYTLNNEIDRIEKDSNATNLFSAIKNQETLIQNGYDKLVPVPAPSQALLKALPPMQAGKLEHDTKVANYTISEWSKIRGWNWRDQNKALSEIEIKNDPVALDGRSKLAESLVRAQKEQTENPFGWQLQNDSEFQMPLPDSTPQALSARINRMVALQGPAPEGISEEEQKRYLNLPTGLQKASSVQQATERAARYNNTPPNQLTKLISDFDSEFTDPKISAMVWNDMQHLPEGSKLKMGLRVAAAIEDPNVRNNFLGAMSNKEPLKTEDGRDKFVAQLSGQQDYVKFVSGWKGDGNQRGNELSEFGDSITRYAMTLAADNKLKTKEAVDLAVKRIVTDNYGNMTINGSEVPIHRFPKGGGFYDDTAIAAMQQGITESLASIDVKSIATDLYHFPLQPKLPGDQTEANRYLQRTINATGIVVPEPDGKSVTVYVRGDGANDFPFQLRSADGMPLLWDLENMMTRGASMQFQLKKASEKTFMNSP